MIIHTEDTKIQVLDCQIYAYKISYTWLPAVFDAVLII